MRQRRTVHRVLILVTVAMLGALSAACASQATSTPDTVVGHDPGTVSSPLQGNSSNQSGQSGQSGSIAIGGQCPASATDPAIVKLRAQPAEAALPAGFHVVAAVRCVTEQRTVPGNGEWQFADAQRADSGLSALVAALRLPSKTVPPGTQIACTAVGLVLPPFALVDAGGAIARPLLPHDECGMPLAQVMTALGALPWHTETEEKLNQLQTQPEIDTGCSPAYKDLFELFKPPAQTPPKSLESQPDASGPATLCAYTVVPPTSGPIVEGVFVHGLKLSTAQQTAVIQGIRQATTTPAPACATPAGRFAVIDVPGYFGLTVELDGCHRLEWPGYSYFADVAPASLLQAMAADGIG